MGECLFSQEIIEHVLQFVDGKTLLTCTEVSPKFAAAVRYLSKTKNIWKKCYSEENGQKYPYDVISKLHPHEEGFRHSKNWGLIYESCSFRNILSKESKPLISQIKIGKDDCDIQDVQTHGDLILLLVKYNKNFSIYYKILTIDLDDIVIDKSSKFYADVVYITPIGDSTNIRRDAISLHCDYCELVAVPVDGDASIEGFPKFRKNINFLTVEHSNRDILWINNFQGLLSKGNCFHEGGSFKHEEVKIKDSKSIKIMKRFSNLIILCGESYREYNTFKELRATITASKCYSNLIILGTDTGMVYVYDLSNDSDIRLLDLQHYMSRFNVSSDSILMIDVMELKDQFVIICCSAKSLYRVHLNRNLKTLV